MHKTLVLAPQDFQTFHRPCNVKNQTRAGVLLSRVQCVLLCARVRHITQWQEFANSCQSPG
jgi:hypothetical protein